MRFMYFKIYLVVPQESRLAQQLDHPHLQLVMKHQVQIIYVESKYFHLSAEPGFVASSSPLISIGTTAWPSTPAVGHETSSANHICRIQIFSLISRAWICSLIITIVLYNHLTGTFHIASHVLQNYGETKSWACLGLLGLMSNTSCSTGG